ncbi:MAG TPA: xanthine dehydrogenase family protein subunit M [Syntrophorhabdaceae bacterium]|nr:xanthine dehydrogenase family protein subunit M [Syntrophorhabdaceae bacterium]
MLLLPRFDYEEPKDLHEACKIMAGLKDNGKILAGGTDLLVNMKKGLIFPKCLVSIGKIPGLSEIEPQNGSISIGSNLIVAKLTEFDLIKQRYSILYESAASLGSPLIRNRATIGGNIVTARPAADLPPSLIALSARIKLKNKKGERELKLEDFFKGPGETVIKKDEIMTSIIIDEPPPFSGGNYIKLGHRRALEIAIVAVASFITLDKPDGIIKDAKILLSAVAPTVIHAVSAEGALIGEKPTGKLIEKVASLASQECSPIDDIRGGAQYRCAMVEVLTKRTLTAALKQAKKSR